METGVAVTLLALMFTVYAFYNGRATRNMLEKLFSKMDERAEQRHREVMESLKQQHQDVVEFLKQNQEIMKRGFRELIQHRGT